MLLLACFTGFSSVLSWHEEEHGIKAPVGMLIHALVSSIGLSFRHGVRYPGLCVGCQGLVNLSC